MRGACLCMCVFGPGWMSSVSASSFFSRRNVTCAAVAGGACANICEGLFHGFLFPLYCRSGHSCPSSFAFTVSSVVHSVTSPHTHTHSWPHRCFPKYQWLQRVDGVCFLYVVRTFYDKTLIIAFWLNGSWSDLQAMQLESKRHNACLKFTTLLWLRTCEWLSVSVSLWLK